MRSVSDPEVRRVLAKATLGLADLPTLLSPAAQPYLELMAQKSQVLTRQRFGKTMQVFVPMYLSNECFNQCSYCGFSMEFKYPRKTLTESEMIREYEVLYAKGFRHVLLLTGESPHTVGVSYIANAVAVAKRYFDSVGIEVQPLKQTEYAQVIAAGADSLSLYQETYHPESYLRYHRAGKKRNFDLRLDAVDAGGAAGFYRINVGALLGLHDWKYEAIALAHHLDYLQKHYWQSKLGVSFPRIQEMFGEFLVQNTVSDAAFVQLICAFRLVFPDLAITLSTREKPAFRDRVLSLGVTAMSAESKTNPGGYSGGDSESQFETSDHRSLAEIQGVLAHAGLDTVMKDWGNF